MNVYFCWEITHSFDSSKGILDMHSQCVLPERGQGEILSIVRTASELCHGVILESGLVPEFFRPQDQTYQSLG